MEREAYDLGSEAYCFTARPSFADLPPLPDPLDEVFDDNLANPFLRRMKEEPTQDDKAFLESYRVTFLTLLALKTMPVRGVPPMLEILGLPFSDEMPAWKERKVALLEHYRDNWADYAFRLAESRKLADEGKPPVTLRYTFIPPVADSIIEALKKQCLSPRSAEQPPAER